LSLNFWGDFGSDHLHHIKESQKPKLNQHFKLFTNLIYYMRVVYLRFKVWVVLNLHTQTSCKNMFYLDKSNAKEKVLAAFVCQFFEKQHRR